ncbi:MAG: hypothetical protein ABJM11_16660 [Marinobacter sp.]|uniref:hypothetical protein n=1 Tax=Marinobacter sp. TaxID=50741 RepID=UPI0032967CA0
MGSKRFKNKTCAYCSVQAAVTGDHVFAREFFLKEHRANLPQAPTCDRCNNEKSKLEHYLTALLPFGGRHKHSGQNLTSQVPKRLDKNQRLHRELREGQSGVRHIQGDKALNTFALPIREGAIEALFEYIVKGLVWHHWRIYLDQQFPVQALVLSDHGREYFDRELFSKSAAQRVFENLGDSTVIYEGSQGVGRPEITVWRFHIYGGIILADGEHIMATEIGAISGPKRVIESDT